MAEFEEYVETEYGGWKGPGRCGGCLEHAPRLTRGRLVSVDRTGLEDRRGANECDRCMRGFFDHEHSASTVAARCIAGAGVAAGLAAGADLDEMHYQFQVAIDAAS